MSEFNTATLKCKIGKGYIDTSAAGGLSQDAYVGLLEDTAEDLILPEGPEYIRPYMFEACKPLRSVHLPSGLVGIGDYAFSSCANLAAVGVSGSTGSAAAADPEMLQALQMLHASEEDGKSREMGGNSDKYELGQPGIRDYAFYECSELQTVVLPDGLSYIGYYAFCACEALTDITLPTGLVYIDTGAFNGCSALKNIVLPANLLAIENYAFSNCSSLENIVFPKKLEYLGGSVFSWCEALTTVTFNGKPTRINERAFSSCSNLAVINVPWAEDEVNVENWGLSDTSIINYNYTA